MRLAALEGNTTACSCGQAVAMCENNFCGYLPTETCPLKWICNSLGLFHFYVEKELFRKTSDVQPDHLYLVIGIPCGWLVVGVCCNICGLFIFPWLAQQCERQFLSDEVICLWLWAVHFTPCTFNIPHCTLLPTCGADTEGDGAFMQSCILGCEGMKERLFL